MTHAARYEEQCGSPEPDPDHSGEEQVKDPDHPGEVRDQREPHQRAHGGHQRPRVQSQDQVESCLGVLHCYKCGDDEDVRLMSFYKCGDDEDVRLMSCYKCGDDEDLRLMSCYKCGDDEDER